MIKGMHKVNLVLPFFFIILILLSTVYYVKAYTFKQNNLAIITSVPNIQTLQRTINITSGPNVQMIGQDHIAILWTTNVKSTGFVEYGPD